MEGFAVVAGIVIVTVLVSSYNHRARRKWRQEKMLASFGKKPEEADISFEQIRILWEKTKEENGLDDITWNDLDMDTVFGRINTCVSWAGEQYL